MFQNASISCMNRSSLVAVCDESNWRANDLSIGIE